VRADQPMPELGRTKGATRYEQVSQTPAGVSSHQKRIVDDNSNTASSGLPVVLGGRAVSARNERRRRVRLRRAVASSQGASTEALTLCRYGVRGAAIPEPHAKHHTGATVAAGADPLRTHCLLRRLRRFPKRGCSG